MFVFAKFDGKYHVSAWPWAFQYVGFKTAESSELTYVCALNAYSANYGTIVHEIVFCRLHIEISGPNTQMRSQITMTPYWNLRSYHANEVTNYHKENVAPRGKFKLKNSEYTGTSPSNEVQGSLGSPARLASLADFFALFPTKAPGPRLVRGFDLRKKAAVKYNH